MPTVTLQVKVAHYRNQNVAYLELDREIPAQSSSSSYPSAEIELNIVGISVSFSGSQSFQLKINTGTHQFALARGTEYSEHDALFTPLRRIRNITRASWHNRYTLQISLAKTLSEKEADRVINEAIAELQKFYGTDAVERI